MSAVNPRLVYWISAVHKHSQLSAAHRDVLVYLAVMRLDFGAGKGYCSVRSLAEGRGWHEATVKRALDIAQNGNPRLLVRTRRGHRLGDGRKVASEWQLIYPPMSTAQQGNLDTLSTAQGSDVEARSSAQPCDVESTSTAQNSDLNSAELESQQRTGAPPTGIESPSGSESSSLSAAVAALRSVVPDATETETKIILGDLTNRGARSALAVLRREITDGGAPALVAKARATSNEASRPCRPAGRPSCGQCNPFRRLEDNEGHDLGPCPTCHPGSGKTTKPTSNPRTRQGTERARMAAASALTEWQLEHEPAQTGTYPRDALSQKAAS